MPQATGACIAAFGATDGVAIAFSDEPVSWGPPPAKTAATFEEARAVAAEVGVRLVDWMCCDDQLFRSSRLALWPDGDPWDDE